MELFKLLGTIAIDNSNANKALKETSAAAKDTAEDVEETSTSGEKASSKWGNAFKKIGAGAVAVGKTVAAGLGVAATAIGGLTVKALSSAGELEQNMGGSEAVFAQYADKMQAKAKEAFSNMGLSTSDYLATANKMGALFQGSGFSIEESMTLSSDAMQRAADVASIMGIDTASAMEAIAGAAKGNFTMLDNLGVAMNDTTLNAYALEKGIDKTTQEMTNQEKIGLAMEMFMEKTAYAAGNYAKENETLAGSLGTAKAALSNFLSGSGTVEDVVSSFSNAANVIVKNINELFPSLMSGITSLVDQIVPMIPPLLQKLLPGLLEGATSLINGLVAAMPQIINALMSALPALIDGIRQIMNALIEALPSIMEALASALPTLIPILIDAIVDIIVTICEQFSNIIQPLIDYLPEIIISIVGAIMDNLPILIGGLITLVMGIVEAIPQIIEALVDALPDVISMIIIGLLECTPQLIAGFIQLITGVAQSTDKIFDSLRKAVINTMKGVWNAIINIFKGEIKMPKIKMPHFSISPSGWKIGDLLKGEMPKLGIEWYAQAMNNPMVMNTPTIFGYNGATGQFMGGGESGSEVVSGTNTLMNMIGAAVDNKTATPLARIIELLNALLNALVGGNEELLRAVWAGKVIKLNEREVARTVREYA